MRYVKILVPVAVALFAAACNRDPQAARQKYLESGNKYFNNGKFKEAAIMYRNSLKQDMRFGEAHYRLALTQVKLQQIGEALRSFQRAVELQPDNLDAPAKVAEIYLTAYSSDPKHPPQYLKEAEDMVKKLITKDANNFDGLRLRAYLHLAKEEADEAIADFKRANEIKPFQQSVVLALAQTYIVKQQPGEAEALVKAAIEKDKGGFPYYDVLYGLYMREKKIAEAEKILIEKQNNGPKNPMFIMQLAAHYLSQNQKAESEKQLQRLISNPKDFPAGRALVGDFYFRSRDFDRAIEQYKAGAAADASKKGDFNKRIVQTLMAQGKTSEATAMVAEILKDNPKDDVALAMRASLVLRSGTPDQLKQAVNDLQAVVSRSPENFALRFEYGRALIAKGDLDQARLQMLEAIKLRPDFVAPRVALAQIYMTKGDFPNAQAMANEILRYEPNNLAGKLLKSSAMIGLRQYVEARSELNALLEQNPALTDAQFQLGMLNMNEGKVKEAESVFRRLYQQAPQDPRGLMGAIDALIAQNQYPQAQQLILAELQKTPDRADLRMALANTAYRAGNYDMAIAEYKKVQEKYPKDVTIVMRLGEAYRAKGDLNSAISTIQLAAQLAPGNAMPTLTLAMLFDASGQAEKSKSYYEQVLTKEPDNAMALNNLAYIMAEQGTNLDQALTMVQKAKQKLPNNPEVSDTLGWIYIKKNLSDSAIGIYRDLLTKFPERSTFHYHLGMAYFQKGDRPQAKKVLQTALTKGPSKTEEAKIKELIAKCG